MKGLELHENGYKPPWILDTELRGPDRILAIFRNFGEVKDKTVPNVIEGYNWNKQQQEEMMNIHNFGKDLD